MSLEYSTATVDDPSQLSYWRQVVSEAFVPYDVTAPRRRTEGFQGTVSTHAIAGMQVATVEADPHTVFRTPSLIRRSPQDDFLVNLAVRGSVIVTQDERDAVLRPGEFTLYDSSRPCRITGPDRFRAGIAEDPPDIVHRILSTAAGRDGDRRSRRSRRRRPALALPPLAGQARGRTGARCRPAGRHQCSGAPGRRSAQGARLW